MSDQVVRGMKNAKINYKKKKSILSIFLLMTLILLISGCRNQSISGSNGGTTDNTEDVSVTESTDISQEEPEAQLSDFADITISVEESEIKTTPSKTSEIYVNEEQQEKTEAILQMKIEDTVVRVEWEDNESVQELKDLCSEEPLVIQMSMYGGFEQVGSIGTSLPRNDKQITTREGDIVLYSGNQIAVFYGENSWAYTRLGHITDQDTTSMAELLGNGDVKLTVSNEYEK